MIIRVVEEDIMGMLMMTILLKDLIHILITIIIPIHILITIIIQKVSSGPTVGRRRWEGRALASSSTSIIVIAIVITPLR